jgi:hypothetical protein
MLSDEHRPATSEWPAGIALCGKVGNLGPGAWPENWRDEPCPCAVECVEDGSGERFASSVELSATKAGKLASENLSGETHDSSDGRKASSRGLVNCSISSRNPNNQDSQSKWRTAEKCLSLEVIAAAKKDRRAFYRDQSVVTGFQVLDCDVVTVRTAVNPTTPPETAVRGIIKTLSTKSRRRMAIIAGNTPVNFRTMVTLTYPKKFPCDGHLVKAHLQILLKRLDRKIPGILHFWFLEFQRREAPHFHIFLDNEFPAPLGEMRRRGKAGEIKTVQTNWPLQDWLAQTWFEIVGSGDPRHLRAGTAWEVLEKANGFRHYMAKECHKPHQKWVPKKYQNVGRFWGCSKGVAPEAGEFIPANLAEMRGLFPGALDADGYPFPVLFGAAEIFRKSGFTPTEPDSRDWIDPENIVDGGWEEWTVEELADPFWREEIRKFPHGKERP